MQINQMKAVRARQLYDAEITTPAQLAQLEAGFSTSKSHIFTSFPSRTSKYYALSRYYTETEPQTSRDPNPKRC